MGRNCWICDRTFFNAIESEEHLIPNAIGGRKTVRHFICRDCNSGAGQRWESALASQLNYLGILFDIQRQRGRVPSMRLKTANGKIVEVLPGNRRILGKPTHEVSHEGSKTTIHMRDRSVRDIRKRILGIGRKYSQINVNDWMEKISTGQDYDRDPMHVSLTFGGSEFNRSMVKSAAALACDSGLSIKDCDLAVRFLRDECSEYSAGCLFDYYQSDLISSRVPGMPLHCVQITGNPSTGLLLAYVEFFGAVRKVLCLSRTYRSQSMSQQYSINPITGEELDNVIVDLDDSKFTNTIATQTQDGMFAGLNKAMCQIIGAGMELSRQRELDRFIRETWNGCLSRMGKSEADEWTESERICFSECFADSVAPLLLFHMMPIEFPEGFDPSAPVE